MGDDSTEVPASRILNRWVVSHQTGHLFRVERIVQITGAVQEMRFEGTSRWGDAVTAESISLLHDREQDALDFLLGGRA